MKLTFLGTGGSSGTPSVHGGWGDCDPENPKNRRLRPSILLQEGPTSLLVDTSPDLREQSLRAQITSLSAVIYTHGHADHLHGIDDIRAINRAMNAAIDCYGPEQTIETIHRRFSYAFVPHEENSKVFYKPSLVPHAITDGMSFKIGVISVQAFSQDHGYSQSYGYRFNDLAYCTDVRHLSDAAFDIIGGVEVMVVGALVDRLHPTHAHVDLAVDWIKRAGARRGYLTHLGMGLDHGQLERRLPEAIRPAFDGLIVDF